MRLNDIVCSCLLAHYEDMCVSDTVFSLSPANLNSAIDDDKRALKSEDVIKSHCILSNVEIFHVGLK